VPLGLSRRVVLSAPIVAVFVSSCAAPGPEGRDGPRSDADLARDRAAAAERDLIAAYDTALAQPVVTATPALAAQLASVRTEHVEHLVAIGQAYAVPPPSSASPTGGAPTSTSAPMNDAKSAVGALVKAEQDSSTRLTADVMALDGITAQLLASIAAAEAGHAALLLGGPS
jgi:hypothetical protein